MTDNQINNDALLQLLNIKSKLNSNASLSIFFIDNVTLNFRAEWGHRDNRFYRESTFDIFKIKRSNSSLMENFINEVNREIKND